MQYHVIDVFTDKLFRGNPAGVCPLDEWLDDDTLQRIAAENNLSETAFFVKRDGDYELRWFTPSVEIDLCGHATMASAFVLFEEAERAAHMVQFKTMSGLLAVTRENDLLYLDFPARPVAACPVYPAFEKAFDVGPVAVYKAVDFLVEFDHEDTVRNLSPDFSAFERLSAEAGLKSGRFGVIVTARGSECDFVSRFFAPGLGINEDPVTGRAHCSLIPFWSARFGKSKLAARQLSRRGGELFCEACGDRVKIGGRVVRYLRGEIDVNGK